MTKNLFIRRLLLGVFCFAITLYCIFVNHNLVSAILPGIGALALFVFAAKDYFNERKNK